MKLLKVTLLTAALAVPVGAFAGIPVAVDFSAPSLIEQMMSKIQQAELIAKQVAQIKNQAQMLEGIGSTNAGDLNALLGQMRTAMNQANSIVQQSSQVQEKYKSLFPDNYENQSFEQLENRQDKWLQHNRDAQVDARRIQATVAHSQQGTAASVNDTLMASQAAPGPTAATQATNQLLATVTAQLTQMQNLLIAQHQVMQDALATRKAHEQRAEAMYQKVRVNPNGYASNGNNHDFTPNRW